MLKYRLMTAAVLIPLAVWGILVLPSTGIAIIVGCVTLLAAWEWLGLMRVSKLIDQVRGLAILLALTFFLWLLILAHLISSNLILLIAVFWWIAAAVLVGAYPRLRHLWLRGKMRKGIMGLLVLVPFWIAIVKLHSDTNGPYLLLVLMLLIWGADSAAYFAGRRFGRRKLAPRVSPGKTIEGALGAFAGTFIVAIIAEPILRFSFEKWLLFLFACLITVAFSILGDLFESMMKRARKVKDSGNLLPGHGGILDRIDSLTAAAPIFTLLVYFFSLIQ